LLDEMPPRATIVIRMSLKSRIRKFVPESLLLSYHHANASLASAWFGHPTQRMIVIGVTGTKGKTSTCNFLWSALSAGGLKVGLTGTANIRIGDQEEMNRWHMSMPGAWALQGVFAKMEKAGCTHVIVETTSEGLKQHRQVGITYDIGVFTNLTPEHLLSHGGSFEEYKKAKGKLFEAIAQRAEKTIDGKRVSTQVFVNHESPHADYFSSFGADDVQTFGLEEGADVRATQIESDVSGVAFQVDGTEFHLALPGVFNVVNALPSVAIGRSLGLSDAAIARGLLSLGVIPGRMERMDAGQDFLVFVDYAHEKESMTVACEAGRAIVKGTDGRVIVLLGAEGGGRDKTKRPAMGEVVARLADVAICSNVDPYEDNPTPIAEDIAVAAEAHGMHRGENLFVIEDRREGIKKALSLAKPGDVVLITGKGAEQTITIGGRATPWDDREVVGEELPKFVNSAKVLGH
jgi:UDP-N-acetylmuramoyl-L-alanyl-D-glutamate--2,6-diaminopimelate ligase